MRKGIAALVVAGLAFAGWWIYASWLMRDRATQLVSAVGSEILVVTRDVRGLPDEADVRNAIAERARELGAEVADLEITREEVERPAAGDAASNQLQKIMDRLQKGRVGMNPTSMGPSLTSQPALVVRKYAVHGEIVVSYGLWTHREPLDVEKVLQRQLVR